MIKMIRSNKKLDTELLSIIEKYFLIKMPKKYREFLLECNGGETQNKIFFFKNIKEDGSILDKLFGIVNNDYQNLLLHMRDYKDRIPNNLIPIGDDPGGNLILLSVKGSDYGKVYFWDHELEADPSQEQVPDYSNLTLIADSFEEFINSLKSEEEVETANDNPPVT